MLRRKRTIVIISIFIVGFIGLFVYLLIPKTYILFTTAPGEVTVLLNNKDSQTVKNQTKMMVSPGHYTIVVSRSESM
jgi:hypothetical protein